MKAFLLAAGLGTRLRPLTDTIPKCMVPIKGKPLLGYWLDMLFASKIIQSAIINTHYLHEKVEDFVSASPYRKKIELVYEKELLGTAGTIFRHQRLFDESPLMLIHADNYSVFNVDAFVSAHENRPQNCRMTMMTFSTDMPETCGIVDLDERGVVRAFYEKITNPPGNLANGAVYILEKEILDDLDPDVFDFSTQVVPRYMGCIYTFENKTYHRDIGTPESYLKAQKFL